MVMAELLPFQTDTSECLPGTFIYNVEVDFRWRGIGKTQPKYSCALMLYSWGRQVLSKKMDTSVVTDRPSLQTTRDALISQLKPTASGKPQQVLHYPPCGSPLQQQ